MTGGGDGTEFAGSGHVGIGSGDVPEGVSADDHECRHFFCPPVYRLFLGSGNDAQVEDGVHDPSQGLHFGCFHVADLDVPCPSPMDLGCGDGLGDRWRRLGLSVWRWVRWWNTCQSKEWSLGGPAQL